MGRPKGFEPSNAGATIRCVNRFTTAAIYQASSILHYRYQFVKSFLLFFKRNSISRAIEITKIISMIELMRPKKNMKTNKE